MAVRGQVNVGDSGPWSTTSEAATLGVNLAVRGRVNVGDSVPWSTASGPVSRGMIWRSEAESTLVIVIRGALLVVQCPGE